MNSLEMDAVKSDKIAYEMVYPEVYYKVMPFVTGVCDQMEAFGGAIPSAEVIGRIADNIYMDVTNMYPDLADYVSDSVVTSGSHISNPDYNSESRAVAANYYGRRFRRRGLFRDFIEILLLNEIFHRIRNRW